MACETLEQKSSFRVKPLRSKPETIRNLQHPPTLKSAEAVVVVPAPRGADVNYFGRLDGSFPKIGDHNIAH